MGKESGAKAWAMVLMTVMVLSAFGGLSGIGEGPATNKVRASEIVYWMEDFEGYTPGDPIGFPIQTATAAVPPPGSPPGTIYPNLTTGLVCAHLVSSDYFSSIDINGSQTTNAILGGWVYMNADVRLDFLLVNEGDYITIVQISFFPGGSLVHWDGAMGEIIPGPSWAPGEWHELWVDYDEASQTYSVWWDGNEYVPNSPFIEPSTNIESFVWIGDSSCDVYIDNCYHWYRDLNPIANAGPDQLVPQHTVVTFDGSLSTDDVGITNYWWNFTDGANQTLTGMAPPYTFDNEGIYTVTLTVMDTIGQTDNDIMIVNVTDGDPPVADAGPDQEGQPGDMFIFNGTASYDPGHLGEPIIDGIVNWMWTFDDGTGPQILWGPNPTHQFNIPGTYTVTLTVTDNAPAITGGPYTDTDQMIVTVFEVFDMDMTPAMNSNGWILMSYPTKISGHPFAVIVDALDEGGGFVQWDMIRGWDNKNKTWITSAKFWPPSLNTFNYVDNTMGFWLHISDYGDGNLTLAGPLALSGAQATIPLRSGWNLVGYPFPNAQPMANTFGTLMSLMAVETYDSSPPPIQPYHLRPVDIWTEWHEPGSAYWVLMGMDEDLWMWNP